MAKTASIRTKWVSRASEFELAPIFKSIHSTALIRLSLKRRANTMNCDDCTLLREDLNHKAIHSPSPSIVA